MNEKIFRVTFQYSSTTYCSNIAIATCKEDVEKHYSNYGWVNIEEGNNADLEEANRKGKPVVECKHEELEKTIEVVLENKERNEKFTRKMTKSAIFEVIRDGYTVSKVKYNLLTYKVELPDDRFEIIEAACNSEAIKRALSEHRNEIVFNIYLLNDDYDVIKCVY